MTYRPRVRLATACAVASALLCVTQFVVRFLESFATVRGERAQDLELLSVCASGAAKDSPRMRAACLSAQAERASPLMLKAVVHTAHSMYQDFVTATGTPFSFAVVLLFVVTSLAMPMRSWLTLLLGAGRDDGPSSNHVVVVAGDGMDGMHAYGPSGRGMRQRAALLFRRAAARYGRGKHSQWARMLEMEGGGAVMSGLDGFGGVDDDECGYTSIRLGPDEPKKLR